MARRRIPNRLLIPVALALTALAGCSSLPKEPVADSEPARRSSSFHALGDKHLRAGRFEKACTFYEQALALNASIDDLSGVARAFSSLGRARLNAGKIDEAEIDFRCALDSAADLRDPTQAARALTGLGEVALHRQRAEEARSWIERGLRLSLPESSVQRTILRHDLGSATWMAGDVEGAEEHFRQALVLNEALGNRIGIAADCYSLARLVDESGDPDQARLLARRALRNDKRAQNPRGVAEDLSLLASLAERQGNATAAADYHRRAQLAWQSLGRSAPVENKGAGR